MNIIIPMAGMGKRMRPHTLTTPKPLLHVAGKPIVQHLVEELIKIVEEDINEIGFVVGRFGKKVEQELLDLASSLGTRGKIYYQDEPLGTGHAVLCGGPSLQGETIVAFADTIFFSDLKIDRTKDGVIWVQEVEDPSAFGVVTTDERNIVTGFVEKPSTPVSNKAIIGIYYFKEGEILKQELQYLIDNRVIKKGEYQLTDALENMREKGKLFTTSSVDQWLDCGNFKATVISNHAVLERNGNFVDANVKVEDSVIIPPCYIGKDVMLKNSVVGPHVSVGQGTKIQYSVVQDSIIGQSGVLQNVNLLQSMIGSHVNLYGKPVESSVGDYCEEVY
jgi:glucose-1-phosphate thymidylyltransferase